MGLQGVVGQRAETAAGQAAGPPLGNVRHVRRPPHTARDVCPRDLRRAPSRHETRSCRPPGGLPAAVQPWWG